MNSRTLVCVALAGFLGACGGSTDSGTGGEQPGGQAGAAKSAEPLTIEALPDPCEWLSAAEAQKILGLEQPPQQTPMGGPDTAGRSCVYSNPDRTAWINVGYEGLNPQVFSAAGKSGDELVELAGNLYAHGLSHVRTSGTRGLPTLAFEDAERTIMVVFTDVGKARDLPDGFPGSFSISAYYSVLLHLFAPTQSGQQRLAELTELVERPVAQLRAAAG